MTTIELQFPALGESLPADHGYGLYAAISRLLPELHRREFPLAVGPISGLPAGGGLLHLGPRSALRLRLPADRIAAVLPLAGKSLVLNGHRLRLGVPQVRSLTPAAALVARLVTIKLAAGNWNSPSADTDPRATAEQVAEQGGAVNRPSSFTPAGTSHRTSAAEQEGRRPDCLTPDAFRDAVRRKLVAMGIAGEPSLPPAPSGPHAGRPCRRILRIKEKKVVGYSLLVTGLSAEDSLLLQSQPDPATAFSRRKLGCAFFVPARW